jgi:hypothetical protein
MAMSAAERASAPAAIASATGAETALTCLSRAWSHTHNIDLRFVRVGDKPAIKDMGAAFHVGQQ